MKLFSRSSKGRSGRAGLPGAPADVFEQPERSLLGEALSRPIGFCAAVVLAASAGGFAANHFFLHMDRVDDFALLGFFVSGGLLISTLLRAGDPDAASQRRTHVSRPEIQQPDIMFDNDFEQPADRYGVAPGFAEAQRPAPVMEPEPEFAPMRHPDPEFAPMRHPDPEFAPMRHPEPELAPVRRREPDPEMLAPVPPVALVEPNEMVEPDPDPDDNEVGGFEQALAHYVSVGDLHGQGEILRRLGHVAKSRGHLKEAREFYMNSRSCFRKINDNYAEAAVLLDLGQVLESLEEHDAASTAYRDANRALLDVAMNAGDRYNAVQAQAAD